MNAFRKLEKSLRKGPQSGPGSRGGHVIGHTKSGKPIYDTAQHESHRGFSEEDHRQAMSHHSDIIATTRQKIADVRAKVPNWNPPQQVRDFLEHHHHQMIRHQNSMSSKMADEQRKKINGSIKKSHEDAIP